MGTQWASELDAPYLDDQRASGSDTPYLDDQWASGLDTPYPDDQWARVLDTPYLEDQRASQDTRFDCAVCGKGKTEKEGWSTFIDELRPLTALLSSEPARDRLIFTCIDGTPQQPYRHLMLRTFHRVYTGRWGSVSQVLADILDVEVLLRQSWNTQKFMDGSRRSSSGAGGGANEALAEGDRDDAVKAGRAVANPRFWAMAHVVSQLQLVLDRFGDWCESCPCHGGVVYGHSWYLRTKQYMKMAGISAEAADNLQTCPLKGCRAPELACGVHMEVLDEAIGVGGAMQVMRDLPRNPGSCARASNKVQVRID